MIISDLNYLENVDEAPSVVGGLLLKANTNIINVRQLALSSATSVAYGGDAIADAFSINNSSNDQFIF